MSTKIHLPSVSIRQVTSSPFSATGCPSSISLLSTHRCSSQTPKPSEPADQWKLIMFFPSSMAGRFYMAALCHNLSLAITWQIVVIAYLIVCLSMYDQSISRTH